MDLFLIYFSVIKTCSKFYLEITDLNEEEVILYFEQVKFFGLYLLQIAELYPTTYHRFDCNQLACSSLNLALRIL